MAIFRSDYEGSVLAKGSYDFEFGGAQDIAMESYADELAMIEAIHAYDMAEIECTREGYYGVTESLGDKAREVWEKIKAFIKKIAAKIKAFFINLFRKISAIFMSNEKFANTYSSKINQNFKITVPSVKSSYLLNISKSGPIANDLDARQKNFDKATGFAEEFPVAASHVNLANSKEEINEIVSSFEKDLEGIMDTINDITDSDIREAVMGDDRANVTLSASDIKTFFTSLASSKAFIQKLKATETKMNAVTAKGIANINKAESLALKKTDSDSAAYQGITSLARTYTSTVNTIGSAVTRTISVYVKCANEIYKWQKSMCMKAIKVKA